MQSHTPLKLIDLLSTLTQGHNNIGCRGGRCSQTMLPQDTTWPSRHQYYDFHMVILEPCYRFWIGARSFELCICLTSKLMAFFQDHGGSIGQIHTSQCFMCPIDKFKTLSFPKRASFGISQQTYIRVHDEPQATNNGCSFNVYVLETSQLIISQSFLQEKLRVCNKSIINFPLSPTDN